MKDNVCPDYCGVACVNGSCPQIENKRYRCDDCWLYEGCKDCAFYEDCPQTKMKGGME